MGTFSLSKSALLASCAWWARPDVTAPDPGPGPSAEIGTAVQARATALINGTDMPKLPDTMSNADRDQVETLWARARLWLEQQKRIGWRSEVKFAWSPSMDAARELPASDELRDYYHKPECPPGCQAHLIGDEVPGSTDIVTLDAACVVVYDLKTGVTPLESYRPQVRSLGMVAARRFGLRRARVILVKIHPERDPEEWSEELDGFALDATAEELRAHLARITTATPRPGGHCVDHWCPAKLACPEVPKAIEALIPAASLVKLPAFSKDFVSHDHDASQLELLRLVSKACDDLKDLIKKRTPADGVVLTDGRILREGSHPETRWRQESLIDLAKKLGATDQDLEMCRYEFQKSEGLKVVKAKSARGKAA